MEALHALLQWTPSGWTAEQISKLRELATSGLTCREIAAQLGRTRNAIIGKLYRLGISVPRKLKQSIDERQAKHAEYQRRYSKFHKKVIAVPRKTLAVAAAKPLKPLKIKLLKLKPKQCRQPYGDKPPFVFCGRKTLGRLSYCATHVRLNYRPTLSPSEARRITERIAKWR